MRGNCEIGSMYIPKHFRQDDPGEIFRFMKAHPFGILLSARDGDILGTHVPFLIEGDAGAPLLVSHLSAANDQWRHFRDHDACMVIFQGPHAYVSPALYAEARNVPTWNFIAVHVYGKLEIVDGHGDKKSLLDRTIDAFEPEYHRQYATLDRKYVDGLVAGMTGFTIKPERIEAKFKLSQNRSPVSRENVTGHFEAQGHGLGEYMRRLYPRPPADETSGG